MRHRLRVRITVAPAVRGGPLRPLAAGKNSRHRLKNRGSCGILGVKVTPSLQPNSVMSRSISGLSTYCDRLQAPLLVNEVINFFVAYCLCMSQYLEGQTMSTVAPRVSKDVRPSRIVGQWRLFKRSRHLLDLARGNFDTKRRFSTYFGRFGQSVAASSRNMSVLG